ncbi:MAG: tripartite tricarboxylate transporter TctB family protein [Deltaproteobacteria bacterium]|nr:tripartite tricarboxylate transporter TctB family protein [Deltaproteobacteria bacterium]
MKKLQQNIAKNKLGLAFCLFLLVFMAILYLELSKLRFTAAAVPFIFMTLTSIFAIIKLLLFLTDSSALKRLDEVRIIKMEMPGAGSHSSPEAGKPLRVIGFILSTFVLLGMVYVLGFLIAALVFGFVFTYFPSRKVSTAIIVSIVLTAVTYVFSSILPGKLWQGIIFGA